MSGSWALTTGYPFSAYTYRGPRLGFACGEISAECGSATTVGSAVHYQKVFGISFIVFHLCITEQTRMTDSKLVGRFLMTCRAPSFLNTHRLGLNCCTII